jgi:tetratricopeptide (TPR) repeat protein
MIGNSDPLVSVVVRSMGRPELASALASIAAQDYANIEVIVVDATGGSHPPLPELSWRPGHVLRQVGGDRRLPRPMACNVGLDAVLGEWFCFLDDDDVYDPHHVSSLIEASRSHPEALVIYGQSRMLNIRGDTEKLFGMPFNRLIMYYGPLFYWQASIISSRVRALGCRFDEALDVCEDRDFLHQIAVHGEFAFVPIVTFNYRPDLGTSGTGTGANRDTAKLLYFDGLLRAKWSGQSEHHLSRAGSGVRRGIEAYAAGDRHGAHAAFMQVLADYPDDPNALHGLARLDFEAGNHKLAEMRVERALELSPQAYEYWLTLALVREPLGKIESARQAAQMAHRHPGFRKEAERVLSRLPAQVVKPESVRTGVLRNQLCSCGSGKRYKHCCGAVTPVVLPVPADGGSESNIVTASALLRAGEAFSAKAIIDAQQPDALFRPQSALAAAEICRELGDIRREYAFLVHASRLEDSPQVGLKLGECVERMFNDISMASITSMILGLRHQIQARAGKSSARSEATIHILCSFHAPNGGEANGLQLYRILSEKLICQLWSMGEPDEFYHRLYPEMRIVGKHGSLMPEGGTLVVMGEGEADSWLPAATHCQRLIIAMHVPELVHMKRLVATLTWLAEQPTAPARIDFIYPSAFWRDRVGMPGFVHYPPTETERFLPRTSAPIKTSSLVIGRHGCGEWTKFHPGEASLIRNLLRRGHTCRYMDGTLLEPKFQDKSYPGLELLPLNYQDAREFLVGLDVFLYWKHPLWIETGGAVILEAMAMALPVIVIGSGVGVAELIESGRDGFLVDTEADALICIDLLAQDAELRHRVGQAARTTVQAVMRDQMPMLFDFYAGNHDRTPAA